MYLNFTAPHFSSVVSLYLFVSPSYLTRVPILSSILSFFPLIALAKIYKKIIKQDISRHVFCL